MSNPMLSGHVVQGPDGIVIIVTFGDQEIAALVPEQNGPNPADHASVEETVAPLLAHMFAKAQEELGYE